MLRQARPVCPRLRSEQVSEQRTAGVHASAPPCPGPTRPGFNCQLQRPICVFGPLGKLREHTHKTTAATAQGACVPEYAATDAAVKPAKEGRGTGWNWAAFGESQVLTHAHSTEDSTTQSHSRARPAADGYDSQAQRWEGESVKAPARSMRVGVAARSAATCVPPRP